MPFNIFFYRFHNPAEEPQMSRNIVPYLDDNKQLSIERYRDKLYEVHIDHFALVNNVTIFVAYCAEHSAEKTGSYSS